MLVLFWSGSCAIWAIAPDAATVRANALAVRISFVVSFFAFQSPLQHVQRAIGSMPHPLGRAARDNATGTGRALPQAAKRRDGTRMPIWDGRTGASAWHSQRAARTGRRVTIGGACHDDLSHPRASGRQMRDPDARPSGRARCCGMSIRWRPRAALPMPGRKWMHVTDLNGLRGDGDNNDLVRRSSAPRGIPVQLGGGFRTQGRSSAGSTGARAAS